MKKHQNIPVSSCIVNLEHEWCASRAALTSEYLLSSSCGFAAHYSRIVEGGKRIVYTGTMAAMLAQNMALPAYADTWTGYVVPNLDVDPPVYGYVANDGDTFSKFVVNNGGHITISSGGRSVQTSVYNGGIEYVEGNATSSAVASSAIIYNGGSQVVSNYGVTSNTIISNGGSQFVRIGGQTSSTIISNGGSQIVYNGTATSSIISGGGQQVVSGGVASNTQILINGSQNVKGGTTSNTNVYAGGAVKITGGTAISTTVASGAYDKDNLEDLTAYKWSISGGSAFKTTINAGAQLVSGGTAVSNTIGQAGNAGFQFVKDGLAVVNTISGNGAWQSIHGGIAVSNYFYNDDEELDGGQFVHGGSAHTNWIGKGTQEINNNAVAITNHFNSNGSQHIINGSAINTFDSRVITIAGVPFIIHESNGRTQIIESNGVAYRTYIYPDNIYIISSGGQSLVPVVNSGGVACVSSGWSDVPFTFDSTTYTVDDTTGEVTTQTQNVTYVTEVRNGGSQVILGGGLTSSAVISAGGCQILSGGLAKETQVYGEQHVSNGLASGTHVYGGGSQVIYGGGNIKDTQFEAGAYQILRGGYTSAQHISNITQVVELGGFAESTILTKGTDGSGKQVVDQGRTFSTVVNSDTVQSVGNSGVVSVGGALAYDTQIKNGGSQIVYAGNSAINAHISSGGSQILDISSSYISAGETVYVSGGRATDTIIESDGVQYVSDGAVAIGTKLAGANASQILSSGGSSINTSTYYTWYDSAHSTTSSIYGGVQSVGNGAYALQTQVSSGQQDVWNGGKAEAADIYDGGVQNVNNGAFAWDTNIYSGGVQNVSAGALPSSSFISGDSTFYTSSITNVHAGGVQNVLAGASAYYTNLDGTDENAGIQDVQAGASAYNTQISSGGLQNVYTNGSTTSTSIGNFGSQMISQGGKAYNTTIAGGTQVVAGNALGGIIFNGSQVVSGATATAEANIGRTPSGTIVYYNPWYVLAGGEQTAIAGGKISAAVLGSASIDTAGQLIYADGGTQNISSGGVAADTIVLSNGVQNVFDSGSATNTVLGSSVSSGSVTYNITGGTQNIYNGGTATDTIVSSGGTQNIYAGGQADQTKVSSGGTQNVLSGGMANSTTVSSGGLQVVSAGGSANATDVYGSQYVYGGATLTNNTLYDTAYQLLTSGAQTSNQVLSGDAVMRLEDGAVATSTYMQDSTSMYIGNGGTANYTSMLDDSRQFIESGGVANHTTLDYAEQYIQDGGVANDTYLTNMAYQHITSGGVANNTVLDDAGEQRISAGGVANNTTVSSGGSQIIYSGGEANSTTISANGEQYIEDGGVANDTTVDNMGSQIISSGGTANGTILLAGGSQVVNSSGMANNTTISAGGIQIVSHGGIVDGLTIYNSGTEVVSDGGITSNVAINSGGAMLVSSGGSGVNVTVNSSGTYEILSGGTADTTIINDSGVQYVSGLATNTTINSGGEQEVKAGGHAEQTNINGGVQYVSIFAHATDTTINAGGSQVISLWGDVQSTTINSGGTQEILEGGFAISTFINAGGLQNVNSKAIASATTVQGGTQEVLSGGRAIETTVTNGGVQNVASDAIASNTLISGGTQNVLSGGSALVTTIENNGVQNVAGIADNTTISNATQNLQSGAVATQTTVYAAGTQQVNSGATAISTVVSGGTLNISDGGVATDVNATSANVNMYAGATLNGFTALGGTLQTYGNNAIDGNVTLGNGAAVKFVDQGTRSQLTVDNLFANNASFYMNVDLEKQTADKLKVQNNYNGTALLHLTNVAATAQKTDENGIKLVEFDSTATVNGTFALPGGQWDQGGYVYKLAQGTEATPNADYYLRSTNQLSDTFKTMLNVPLMNSVMAQVAMNSLQKRLGDLHDMDNPNKKQGVWVRSYYKDMTVNDLIKTDLNLFGAEAGYDWMFYADEPTKLYAGVMVGFVEADTIKTKKNNGMYDKGDGQAQSVGLYATVVNDERWFVDIAARNFWTKLDMNNHAADGTKMNYKPEQNILTLSAEAGRSFLRPLTNGRFVRIEPKAELSYMNAGSDSAKVKNGMDNLKIDSANYLNAKAAVLLSYQAKRANNLLLEPFVELAYRYEFIGGKADVSYGGATKETSLKGGVAEVEAGLNMQLTDNLYWYALGSYEAGEKMKGWGVYAGIRYAFGNVNGKTTSNTKKKVATKANNKTKKKKNTKTTRRNQDIPGNYWWYNK